MKCIKCKVELREGAVYCDQCGKKQVAQKGVGKRRRGNGQGSAYKAAGATSWTAAKVLGYETKPNGKVLPIIDKKSGFATKSEALEYLPNLGKASKKINTNITFKGIYDLWLPEYQKRGRSKSTENCYKAAMKYYRDIWFIKFTDVSIDDLQECVNECPQGRRTKENMKALGTLMYSYALPRGYLSDSINENMAKYLFVGGGEGNQRVEFTTDEIDTIKNSIDKAPYADYIYCAIYLGFRPHEFLNLNVTDYDKSEKCFTGGIKTEAGKNRKVTISPKIQPIIDRLTEGKEDGPVFCDENNNVFSDKYYREECFYPALEKMGFENPVNEKTGSHKYTPHCCRHTFATLMKNVSAPDKDKLSLIGHTSSEMLRHYQHTNYDDLRKITDNL